MLKLFWNPAHGGGAPADEAWQARSDTLTCDADASTLQSFPRCNAAIPAPNPQLQARLDAWLSHRDHTAPLTIAVHGYSYVPGLVPNDANDPFRTIYGIPGPGIPNQLSVLPLIGECDELGGNPQDVAIAFAWLSTGTLTDYSAACWNNSYQFAALDLAPLCARALATVLLHLAARGAAVRILAHSLGTRLTTQAIDLLRASGHPTSITRVVLLGGAEFCVDAAEAFAGCSFDVINLGSRLDAVLHLGAEQGCHPVRPNDSLSACVIGRQGLGANPRWLDLQLDSPAVVNWFASGFAPTTQRYAVDAVARDAVHPHATLNHWAYYTNLGNRVLVHDLVQHPRMTVAQLTAAGAANGMDSIVYGRFNGQPIPRTPLTCAERRGEILFAGSIPQGGSG